MTQRIEAAQKALDAFTGAIPERGYSDLDRYKLAINMADALKALIVQNGERPSQEQMLSWLGIDYEESTDDEGDPSLHLFSQHIEREEI